MINPSLPVAVITGAASGLGLDLAKQLATQYQLVLIDLDLKLLQEQCGQIINAQLYGCDLANKDELDELITPIKAKHCSIALLINNAGITHRSLARITRPEVIEKVMAVDYFAPVRLVSGLIEPLQQAHGKIVNISSMAGWMPVMARAGYCAAKSALHQYFETFRAEMRPTGVSVLMVYPSFLDTPIDKNALNGDGGKTNHARSMVGKMRTSDWMAKQICEAIRLDKQRLFPDRFTYFSALLYRLIPRLYMHFMARKFASEWEVA